MWPLQRGLLPNVNMTLTHIDKESCRGDDKLAVLRWVRTLHSFQREVTSTNTAAAPLSDWRAAELADRYQIGRVMGELLLLPSTQMMRLLTLPYTDWWRQMRGVSHAYAETDIATDKHAHRQTDGLTAPPTALGRPAVAFRGIARGTFLHTATVRPRARKQLHR